MKNTRCFVITSLLAAMLFCVPDAEGQWIPADIPDTPDESPGDREREKREEQHRATFSRFFGTTSVSASPIVTGHGGFFDAFIEGGVEIGRGDALFFMIGARSATDDPAAPRMGPRGDQIDGGGLFALGYELGLEQFTSHAVLRRSSVSFSAGGFMGDVYMLYVDVSPRYIIRTSRYWSLPVGFKVTTAFMDRHNRPVGSVGITAGIRRHFGQRTSLE